MRIYLWLACWLAEIHKPHDCNFAAQPRVECGTQEAVWGGSRSVVGKLGFENGELPLTESSAGVFDGRYLAFISSMKIE